MLPFTWRKLKQPALRYRMKIIFFLSLLTFSGCAHKQEEKLAVVRYFDFPAYFKKEGVKLNAQHFAIIKTLMKDDSTEVVRKDSVDWLLELEPFTAININKPASINSYNVDSIYSNDKLELTYTATDATVPLRKAVIWFSGQEADSLLFISTVSNPYYTSKETLSYKSPGNFNIIASNNPRIGKNVFFRMYGNAAVSK
jgi:hypothetical protein